MLEIFYNTPQTKKEIKMKPARFPFIFFVLPLIIGGLLGTVILGSKKPPIKSKFPITDQPRETKQFENDRQLPILIAAAATKENEVGQEARIETNASSGEAAIPVGKKEVKICNDSLSPNSQVYLTAKNDSNQVIFVKRKAPSNPETGECSHFVAAVAKPLEKDLVFKYWLINE